MPHSPGPWNVEEEAFGTLRVRDANAGPVWYFDHAEQDGRNEDVRLMIAAPELAAALRKVTANLRAELVVGPSPAPIEEDLKDTGVLEAEALLKRIDEGGGHG